MRSGLLSIGPARLSIGLAHGQQVLGIPR